MRNAIRRRLGGATLAYLRHHDVARRFLMWLAARRGDALVLCYHRVAPPARAEEAITPLPPERFAEQMRALQSAGDIVPLGELLAEASSRSRPRFAVTFDDDDRCHVRHALPILRSLGIPATFFLSGRALHNLGPYWWTRLEHSVAVAGLPETCRRVGHQASSLKELIHKCRRDGGAAVAEDGTAPIMPADDIRALADAGMTIGFHTVHHPALPLLDDEQLAVALSEGRQQLAQAAGCAIDFFAYPYGRTDARTANAVRRAGFRAAVTTRDSPLTRGTDSALIGRWQPGAQGAAAFLAEVAARIAIRR